VNVKKITLRRPTRDAIATFLRDTGKGRSIRVYQDREVLYSQQDHADALFYIQAGSIKLTMITNRRRRKAVVAVLQAGDIFGECSLGTQRQRITTATSIGVSTVTRVDRKTFGRKLDQDRVFAKMYTSYLISQIARYKAELADHFLNSSERRLARLLVRHASLVEASSSGYSTLRFSQTALAEMVGTTRARINRFMNEFRKKGYIKYNGILEINVSLLTAFLEL
jgi:CRP/FNR family transcriptional regulator, cyclic AMP receptor protein